MLVTSFCPKEKNEVVYFMENSMNLEKAQHLLDDEFIVDA
jgi:hypothetical protein